MMAALNERGQPDVRLAEDAVFRSDGGADTYSRVRASGRAAMGAGSCCRRAKPAGRDVQPAVSEQHLWKHWDAVLCPSIAPSRAGVCCERGLVRRRVRSDQLAAAIER